MYEVVVKNKNTKKVLNRFKSKQESSICYFLDQDVKLHKHDFDVFRIFSKNDKEYVTHEFVQIGEYWKHDPNSELTIQ